jgi:hypothetical protein
LTVVVTGRVFFAETVVQARTSVAAAASCREGTQVNFIEVPSSEVSRALEIRLTRGRHTCFPTYGQVETGLLDSKIEPWSCC